VKNQTGVYPQMLPNIPFMAPCDSFLFLVEMKVLCENPSISQ